MKETLYVLAIAMFFLWLFRVLKRQAEKERADKIVLRESKIARCTCGSYLYLKLSGRIPYLDERGEWLYFYCLNEQCPNYGREARLFDSFINFIPSIPLHWHSNGQTLDRNDPRVKIID